MRNRMWMISLLLLWVVACEEPASEDQTVRSERYVVSPEPLATIGGQDQRPEHQLRDAESALRLSDGSIVIADVGSSEVRYFNADGEPLSTVGGQGDGPGEFRRLRTVMRLGGDTVATWDASLRRMSVFSPGGEFASVFPIPALNPAIGALQQYYPNGMMYSGTVHALTSDRFLIEPIVEPMSWTDGVIRDTVRYVLADRTSEGWIDLGPLPGWERFSHNGALGPLPFGRNLRFAVGDSHIYMGSTHDAFVQVFSSASGNVIDTIPLPVTQRAVTQDQIDAYRSSRQSRASFMEAVPWPSAFPVFSDLRVGAGGDLWVKLYQAPLDTLQEWMVFQQNGEVVASITLDVEWQLMDGGRDYVLFRVRDELDVEEIRLHGLVPVL